MNKCFVISPIGPDKSDIRDHADDVFNYLIKPAMEFFQIEAFRSDHLKEPGKISDQMFRAILNCNLCVVLLTGHNPNVFYELAVAQSAGRPVIVLIQKGQILPFDVHDLRCIYYDFNRPGSLNQSVDDLKKYVQAYQSNGWKAPSILADYASPGDNIKDQKNDIFVSSPMTSVGQQEYDELKNITMAVINRLKESDFFHQVYYAGQNIEDLDQADPASIAVEQDLNELRLSKYFILIYPRQLVTSSLVEAGFALALKKYSVYFVKDTKDLPYMLREAAQSYSYVRTFIYRDMEHLIKLLGVVIKIFPSLK